MGMLLSKSTSGLLIAVIVVNSVLFAAIVNPQPTHAVAGVGDITFDPTLNMTTLKQTMEDTSRFFKEEKYNLKTAVFEANQTQKSYWDQFKSSHGVIAEIVASLFLVLMHQMLAKITNDIVAWINGGMKGKVRDKIRVLQDPGKFLADAADEAGGVLAGAILNVDSRSLCDASFLKGKLKIALTGPFAVPTFDEKVGCTFSGMADGLRKFKEDFTHGGWTAFIQLTEKPNNRIGQTLIAMEELEKIKAQKSATAVAELQINKGFLPQEKCFVTKAPNVQFGNQDLKKDMTASGITSGSFTVSARFNVEGKEVGEAMKLFNKGFVNNEKEFIDWIQEKGGTVECKTVTPAQQISNLADTALLAPYRRLENSIIGMTEKLGTGAPGVLKPYVLAIASAGLNLMLKKEQGLISGALARASKPRKARRQPTDALAENAQLASSAGALSGSIKDFRSFLLDALLEFSIFISAITQVTESSNRVLGRIPVNRGEFEKAFPTSAPGDVRKQVFNLHGGNVTNFADADSDAHIKRNLLGANYKVYPVERDLARALSYRPARAHTLRQLGNGKVYEDAGVNGNGMENGAYDPGEPLIINENPLSDTTTTYPSGKMFYEQAQWCGAYYQNVVVSDTGAFTHLMDTPMNPSPLTALRANIAASTNCPASWISGAIGNCTAYPDWITYNLDGDPADELAVRITQAFDDSAVKVQNRAGVATRFIRESVYNNGADIAIPFTPNITETIIGGFTLPTASDPNQTTLNSASITNEITATENTLNFKKLFTLHPTHPEVYPQGDIFLAPEAVHPTGASMPLFEKYLSPVYEKGSVTLMNFRDDVRYPSIPSYPIYIINNVIYPPYPPIPSNLAYDNSNLVNAWGKGAITNTDPDLYWLPPSSFYPELMEQVQELMEKLRVIKGYNYDEITVNSVKDIKYYDSSLAQQIGSSPDDDLLDNSPSNPLYNDRDINNDGRIANTDANGDGILQFGEREEKYRGSVNDVLTKYNNITQIYQQLFAGLQDENSLEAVDKDFKILSPEEQNIRLALIGQRCPIVPPSTTSSPDLIEKCPSLTGGEYTMARKFVFEPDDAVSPDGLTTGFATNPFTDAKSSALAGVLNLEEMATQLQSLPPDKNIAKLVRLRQILEQLQVGAPRRIPVPKKADEFLLPLPLSGADKIEISLPDHEKIQNWLNNATDKNLGIQTLIEAYDFVTAKEAYPVISRELDDVFEDITNQVSDKLKEVFLKRIELQLERAKEDAQYRLSRFIEYARDLNSVVKLEKELQPLPAFNPRLIEDKTYVMQIDARNAFPVGNSPLDQWLRRNADLTPAIGSFSENDRGGIIASGAYKIRSLSAFIGIDTTTEEFAKQITSYLNSRASETVAPQDDLDFRVRIVLGDVYKLYTGIFTLTDPLTPPSQRNLAGCTLATQGGSCTLSGGQPTYTDARSKLATLQNDFGLMVEEVQAIKEAFSDFILGAQSQKTNIEDLTERISTLESDYDEANACVGLPVGAGSLWSFTSGQTVLYSAIAGAAAAGLLVGGAMLMGAAIATAAVLGPAAIIVIAVAYFINKRKQKKARRKYKKAVAAAADECRKGIIKYNMHIGQLAGMFVCGKVNPLYKDNAWEGLDL